VARRRRGCLITLIVLLVVVVVLLVVADRVGVTIADNEVATQVANKAESEGVKLGQKPTADIGGFPFLTQVLAGRYDRIDVHLRDVTTKNSSGRNLTLPRLDIRATDVKAPLHTLTSGDGSITANRLAGSAVVPYSYVQQIAQQNVGSIDVQGVKEIKDVTVHGKDGKLLVGATVDISGGGFLPDQEIKVSGQAKLTVTDNSVKIDVTQLTAPDTNLPSLLQSLLDSALDNIAGRLSTSVGLSGLPYDLTVNSVKVADDGLDVTATTGHVVLAQ
jgi:hypothetical protein